MLEKTDGFSSSVHASESNAPDPRSTSPDPYFRLLSPSQNFRHSGWQSDRKLIHNALLRTKQTVSRIRNYAGCGSFTSIMQDPEDPRRVRVCGSNCHDRFCRPCARLRAQCIANCLYDVVETRKCRFLTLTQKHSSRTLKPELDRLYASFARLRRTQFWQDHVTGGAVFCEVKYSERSESWHPHLHILITGRYMPQPLLKKHWYRITGDSTVVDIRAVPDRLAVVRYVTKYVSKGLGQTYTNRPELLDECICAMVGRRLCSTFGAWRGLQLTKGEQAEGWVNIGSFEEVLYKAIDGDQASRLILDALGVDRTELFALDDRAPPTQSAETVALPTDRQMLLPPVHNHYQAYL